MNASAGDIYAHPVRTAMATIRELRDENERLTYHLRGLEPLRDFALNVAGFDDGLLTTPDLNLLRATLREWRAEARAILDAE